MPSEYIKNKWKSIKKEMPEEYEYVLVRNDNDSAIGITRLVDGEWETLNNRKVLMYENDTKFYNFPTFKYWKRLGE